MTGDLQAEARRLYVPGVFGYKRVAKKLGVSTSTAARWINPELAERSRLMSNEAKRRRTGICEGCGTTTRYAGHGDGVSRMCVNCANKERRIWTRESVIAAIQAWAAEHGRPPSAQDWMYSKNGHPAMTSVYQSKSFPNAPFRYWADAIEAAGFERPGPGGRYRERPQTWKFDHEEANRLLDAGMSNAAVARRLGVSPRTIWELAKRGGTFAQRR
jgi:transposase